MKDVINIIKIIYILEEQDAKEEMAAAILDDLGELSRRDDRIELAVYDAAEDGRTWQSCCNQALQEDEGCAWITFLRSSAGYDGKAIEAVLLQAQQTAADAIALEPVQSMDGSSASGLLYQDADGMIDLTRRSWRYWNFCLDSFFFRRSAIGDLRFNEEDPYHAAHVFLMRFFQKTPSYDLCRQTCRIRRFLMTDPDSYRPAFAKAWYEEAIRRSLMPVLQAYPESSIMQSGVLWLVIRKLIANRNNWHKEALRGDEIDRFLLTLTELLQYISDDMIAGDPNEEKTAYDRVLALYLLKLKHHGQPCSIHVAEDGKVCADPGSGPLAVDHISNLIFQIDAMNAQEHALQIDGEVRNIPWADYDRVQAFARCGGTDVPAQFTGICRFEKLFGRTIWRGYMVRIELPEALMRDQEICFLIRYADREYLCRTLRFGRIQARLHHKYRNSYWAFGDSIISRSRRDAWALHAERRGAMAVLGKELRLLREIKEKDLRRLRLSYYLSYPFLHKKNIWITYDQLYKGGDNGEFFFRHVTEHHGGEVDMYYLVNEDAAKADPALQDNRHLLLTGSKSRRERYRMQLTALHADVIFSTRASVDSFFDFHRPRVRAAVCGLYNASIVCIQHGLTVQKIAQYQNRVQDNMRHYFCASPFERDLLLKPAFGYEEDMTSITGLARYDGLKGTAEKQILLCPTWRRNVTDGLNEKGKAYEYNPAFRESVFCRIYQQLISDPQLLQCAKEYGYRILLVLHPNIGAQVRDFSQGDCVQVRSGVGVDYEQLMGASQLMVTDYSGVQFDFAYMRRPLIYYRPPALPPQYEEGVRFEDMAFGPVCRAHEEVVRQLCAMMEKDCALEAEYRENINRFFPYEDRQNCQRLYQRARQLQLEGKI